MTSDVVSPSDVVNSADRLAVFVISVSVVWSLVFKNSLEIGN